MMGGKRVGPRTAGASLWRGVACRSGPIAEVNREQAPFLHWTAAGPGRQTDLRDRVVPEQLQPDQTAFERAAADGVEVVLVGAAADLLSAWRAVLGDAMWVASREEAIAAGWFGPLVLDRVRPRIGDVVAAAREAIGVFDRRTYPGEAAMLGHHGSMTLAQQLVPLMLLRR